MDGLLTLGIETSCDETAVALLRGGRDVLADYVGTQIERHRAYGGVIPEIACRAHMEWLLPGLRDVLARADVRPERLDAIAVTHRPGLIGAVLVGVTAAKALALAWDKPLVGVDHIDAHIAAARFARPDFAPPHAALVVSGGHTQLHFVDDDATFTTRQIAGTLDDAAGEAFDKAAKLLGLGFPGGPRIEKTAEGGDPDRFPWKRTCLPPDGKNWSFSGLKTAVLHAARGVGKGRTAPLLLDAQGVADAAASFQRAVVFALVERTMEAMRGRGMRRLSLGGGVAANGALRRAFTEAAAREGVDLSIPPMGLCTDNAVMVAFRGAELRRAGVRDPLSLEAFSVRATPDAVRSGARHI